MKTKNKISVTLLIIWSLLTCSVYAQQYEWAKRVGGAADEDVRYIVTDNTGNIYITGSFRGSDVDFDPGPDTAYLSSEGGADIYVSKYDSNANYLWSIQIGGTDEDIPAQIKIDASGNVLINGWFYSPEIDFDPGPSTANLISAGGCDIFFAKYDQNGNYLWAHNIGGAWFDGAHGLTLDLQNNVYVTGYFTGQNIDFDPGPGVVLLTSIPPSSDAFFAKYDSLGLCKWAKKIGGSDYEVINGIDLDDDGNLFVSGLFSGTYVDFNPGGGTAFLNSAGGYDIFFAKYDALGNYKWVKGIGGTGDDVGGNIRLNNSGEIYIDGNFKSSTIDFDPGPGIACLSANGGWDMFFAKYSADGNYIWANGIGGAGDDSGVFRLSGEEYVHFTGTFSGNHVDFDPGADSAFLSSAGYNDIAIALYDSSGHYLYANRLGGEGDDIAYCLGLDNSGNILLGGSFNGINSDFDPGSGTAFLSSVGGYDLFFAKYSETMTGIDNSQANKLSDETELHQNYPNPFQGSTTIAFDLPKEQFVVLSIHDFYGRLITTLLEQKLDAGQHEVQWFGENHAGGVYFYCLEINGKKIYRKLIIRK